MRGVVRSSISIPHSIPSVKVVGVRMCGLYNSASLRAIRCPWRRMATRSRSEGQAKGHGRVSHAPRLFAGVLVSCVLLVASATPTQHSVAAETSEPGRQQGHGARLGHELLLYWLLGQAHLRQFVREFP
jgi:hypothetical protein